MSIVFGMFLVILLFSSCENAESETYLIPSDYTGEIQVIFNQNGIPIKYKNEYGHDTTYTSKIGQPVKYENGRRLYEIPSNGILLTQFKNNDGFINREYYSVNGLGERIRLEVFEPGDSVKWKANNTMKGVFGDGVSGSYGNMNIPYQDFTVCIYGQLDSLKSRGECLKFDNRVGALIGLKL